MCLMPNKTNRDSCGLPLGTDLFAFDGQTFYTFQPTLRSDDTILSNRIYNMRLSATGDIWCVSSDRSLYLFNRKESEYINMLRVIPEIAHRKVRAITHLKNNTTWVVFHDASAIRFNDYQPLSDYTFFDNPSALLRGSTRIDAVVLSDSSEWLLTDTHAINTTGRQMVSGRFKHCICHGWALFPGIGRRPHHGNRRTGQQKVRLPLGPSPRCNIHAPHGR